MATGEATTTARPTTRMAGIDGIRAVAALSVFGYHALWRTTVLRPLAPLLGHGDVGVELFFAITGFLVSRPLVAHLAGTGDRVGIGRFWVKRFLRIWPAYLAALAGSMAIGLSHLEFPGGFVKNGLLVQSWFEDRQGLGLRVAWTLVVDVAFCAMVVPLGSLLTVFGRWRLTAWVVSCGALFGFGAWALWVTTHGETIQALRILPPYLPCFSVGMLLAAASVSERPAAPAAWLLDRVRALADHWQACFLAALGVVVALVVFLPANETTPAVAFGRDRAIQSFAQVAIAFFLLAPVVLDRGHPRFLEKRAVLALGLASYGFFLWHIQVLRVVRPMLEGPGPVAVLGLALAIGGAFLLGEASRRWIEGPAGRLAQRLTRR